MAPLRVVFQRSSMIGILSGGGGGQAAWRVDPESAEFFRRVMRVQFAPRQCTITPVKDTAPAGRNQATITPRGPASRLASPRGLHAAPPPPAPRLRRRRQP